MNKVHEFFNRMDKAFAILMRNIAFALHVFLVVFAFFYGLVQSGFGPGSVILALMVAAGPILSLVH